jgi:Holliday junction resolvase RusA-like endonuclease
MNLEVKKIYRIEIECEGLPRIPNNGSHGSYWEVTNEKRKWTRTLTTAIGSHKPNEPLKKAQLTLIRYSSMVSDYDNLVSSFKRVIDALKNIGILADDKMMNIGIPIYRHEKVSPGSGKIKIIVEDIENA